MDAEKAMRGIRTLCNREGLGLATRLLLQLQVTNHQTLIHLRNFEAFVFSMTTLNIFIMPYMEVLKKV